MREFLLHRTPKHCVLNFHGVGEVRRELEPGEDGVWCDLRRVQAILDMVATSKSRVEITVDDGNESDVSVLLAELSKRGLLATFFVCAGRIGKPGFLDRSQLRQLVEAGMGVGSHGWGHLDWRRLAPKSKRREWLDSKHAIEDAVSAPVRFAACPFGSYDRFVVSGIRDVKYEALYTSDRGWTSDEQWLRARNSIRSDDAEEEVVRGIVTPPSTRQRIASRLRLLAKRFRGAPLRTIESAAAATVVCASAEAAYGEGTHD